METTSDILPRRSYLSEVEAQLWEQSLAGDNSAFGQLFDLHRDRVYRHARGLVKNRQDAEDVIGSTFLELWRKRESVRVVDGSVLPWLLATATNIGLNATRSRRRYRQLLERLPRASEEPAAPDMTRGLEVSAGLRDALRTLRTTDAQLLALVALEGFQVNEAAICLGLSSQAARARLHRTRMQLQELLRHEPATRLQIEETTK